MPTPGPASETTRRRRLPPLLLAWLLTATWCGVPYLMAALRPPPGTAFSGFFYYDEDHYNYLSYVEQAQRGAFLFTNKLVLEEHDPALVNLEWLLVGRLSAALGGHPLIAYRIFGLLAALGLLVALDLWLRRGGLPATHRLPALALVTTGGGLGGVLWSFAGRPVESCLDIYAGVFPFLGLLANPHFTAGTTLLLAALWLYEETAFGRWARVAAPLLGTALAVVRPYDFVLLVAIRGLVILSQDPPRSWPKRLLPMAALLPAAGYLYWIFYRNPAFAFYPEARYGFPPTSDFLWALGPAFLAGLLLYSRPGSAEARRMRAHLLAWAAIAAVVIAARPVHFSLQFLVGVGTPLLALVALGLARWAPLATLAVACLFAGSAATVVRFLSAPSPRWFVAVERLTAAESIAPSCGPRDVLFAPPDIGLFAAGLTPCRAWVSHPIVPDYAQRAETVRDFYLSWPGDQRTAFLDANGISHLLLPGDAGQVPEAWLGPATGFRRLAIVGTPPATLSLYRRTPSSAGRALP